MFFEEQEGDGLITSESWEYRYEICGSHGGECDDILGCDVV
jgi:hypothetical protein